MTLIDRRGAGLVGAPVTRNRGVVEIRGDVPARTLLITIIDSMGPRVGNFRTEAVRHPFVQLQNKPVVPGLAAILHTKHLAVFGIHTICENPYRSRISARLVTIRVKDGIGLRRRRRTKIDVALDIQSHAMTPQETQGETQIPAGA